MTQLLTNEQDADYLAEIRARHAAATDGVWRAQDGEQCWTLHADPVQILKAPKTGTPYAEYWPNEADAALLEHAHADIGWLLRELAEFQAANAAYCGLLDAKRCRIQHLELALAAVTRERDSLKELLTTDDCAGNCEDGGAAHCHRCSEYELESVRARLVDTLERYKQAKADLERVTAQRDAEARRAAWLEEVNETAVTQFDAWYETHQNALPHHCCADCGVDLPEGMVVWHTGARGGWRCASTVLCAQRRAQHG